MTEQQRRFVEVFKRHLDYGYLDFSFSYGEEEVVESGFAAALEATILELQR